MKQFAKILIATVLCAVAAALSPLYASAEKTVVSDRYTFIGNPSYIYCAAGEILILGNDKLLVYSYDYTLLNEYDLPGAVKIRKNDRYTAYSTASGVYLLQEDGGSRSIYTACSDFVLAGDRLYVSSGNRVICLSMDGTQQFSHTFDKSIISLAYADGIVYLATQGDKFGYSNIYACLDGDFVLEYDYCKNLESLLDGDDLYYYGASRITRPETGETVILPGDESGVSMRGDRIYFVTASGEMYLISGGQTTLIFACTSADKGYFAFPRAAASDYGKLFVLDYANDRVAVMEDDITYIDIKRPTAMTADYSGSLYVAGKEGLFRVNVNQPDNVVPVNYPGGAIDSITFAENSLYYTTDGKAYRLTDGESAYVCDALRVRSEYFGGKIYFLKQDGIYKADYSYPTVSVSGAADFDVTSDGSIFVLKDDAVTKYSDQGEFIASYKTEADASAISVSLVTNNYTDYGNIVVTCSSMHKVYNMDVGEQSSLPSANLQYTDTDGIIRTTLEDAYIYQYPCSVSKVALVPAGSTVIAGKYNLYETERMSYVLYEDFSGLKTGYMYKGILSQPAKETTPTETSGRTLYDNTALYRFPTSRGDILVDNIGKNVSVTILPFSKYVYDGVEWLKIRVGDSIGFVAKDMISTGIYVPTDERPQYNATLTKTSQVYDKVNDVYVPIGYTLPSGSDVEIVGVFDQGSEYTLVKYFDSSLGLREGYVETDALNSYSITPLQIIGLLCVGLIAILLISVCIIKFAGKRKRQLSKK